MFKDVECLLINICIIENLGLLLVIDDGKIYELEPILLKERPTLHSSQQK
jgi:hypothetical protein